MSGEPRDIQKSVALVAKPWADSSYYEAAERFTSLFWRQGSVFRRLFDRLDLGRVVELACGHGRHAAQIVDRCGHVALMDIFESNLARCRERFSGKSNVSLHLGNGYSFEPVADASTTAIYCYDAMVHFSPDIVESYLADSARILASGGMALLHHSNYEAPAERHYGQNPHARNVMTQSLFAGFCRRARLEIVESIVIPWGKTAGLDCVTLCRKRD